MLLYVVCAFLVLFLCFSCAFLVLFLCWTNRKEQAVREFIEVEKQNIAADLRQFVSSPSETEPSPLALIADQVALLFASRLWQQVEARMRQGSGETTKQLNEQEEAVLAASNPGLALAQAFLPKKIKNMLKKNPMMVGALSNLTGAARPPGGDHGNSGNTGRKNRD